jgi:hypothetical protein
VPLHGGQAFDGAAARHGHTRTGFQQAEHGVSRVAEKVDDGGAERIAPARLATKSHHQKYC